MKQKIALVAHDNRKADLIQWASHNYKTLLQHHLVCTGTTGKLIKEALEKKRAVEFGEILSIEKLPKNPSPNDKNIYIGVSEFFVANSFKPSMKHFYTFVKDNGVFGCEYETCDTLEEIYKQKNLSIDIECLLSGPIGGDAQMGAKIVNGELDMLIFLPDHMTAQPHDVDVKALIRLAGLYNIPMACNRASADMLITSSLFNNPDYQRITPDFSDYTNRKI